MERQMGTNSLADYSVSKTPTKGTFLDGVKLLKKGIAVDASIVSSIARPRTHQEIVVMAEDRKEEEKAEASVECTVTIKHSRDTDASWIKKGKEAGTA
ncbi:MAG: hypothetical protein LBU06_08810 [Desulfovibrio sp.]|jgi:hypothetical protein|nr:hypothetical protein [Desulfovibrio sp.]